LQLQIKASQEEIDRLKILDEFIHEKLPYLNDHVVKNKRLIKEDEQKT